MLEGITSADNAVSSVYMLQEALWIQYSRGTPEMLIVQTKLNEQGCQPAARFYGRVHNIHYQDKYGLWRYIASDMDISNKPSVMYSHLQSGTYSPCPIH